MVEIFKTNVEDAIHAEEIIGLLTQYFPAFHINFDLQDWDKILRVKGESVPVDKIFAIVSQKGFYCCVLN